MATKTNKTYAQVCYNLTEWKCSFYQSLVVIIWINRNQLQMVYVPNHHHHHQFLLLLVGIGHPWRASKRCDLQLSPWPHSMIFLRFLFHPLLSFATFSSAYLFFYTPKDSNLMRFSLLLLFLYALCVQSNSIFFFLSKFLLASVW